MREQQPLQPWPERSRRSLLRVKVFEVLEATRTSPRTGRDHDFFVLRTLDWINVVAFDREDRLLCVRQFRHGTAAFSLEIPGGVIDPGEDPATAAVRELREETGHAAGECICIGEVHPNPAIQTNRCFTYLATGCHAVGELQQDDGEDLEVVRLTLEEAEHAVRSGELDHSLAVAGLYFYRLHRDGDA